MIERVARAIHLAYRERGVTLQSWARTDRFQKEEAREVARDAIAAMRMPSEAMAQAADRRPNHYGPRETWVQMIDAALKTPSTASR